MKKDTSAIGAICESIEKSVGNIAGGLMTGDEVSVFISGIEKKLDKLTAHAQETYDMMPPAKKRGNDGELTEEYISNLEDICAYVSDIAENYKENGDITGVTDNLEEVMEMLEDLL